MAEKTTTQKKKITSTFSTSKQMATNWQKRLDEAKRLFDSLPVCQKCGYLLEHCRCAELAAQRAFWARRQREWDAQALGGVYAYERFTLSKFDDKALAQRAGAAFQKKSLFFFGDIGTGKTHLGTALIRLKAGAEVKTPTEILRELRACETVAQETRLIDKYATIPLLIDDLRKEKRTDYTAQVFFELINKRLLNGGKNLIITSNTNIDGIADAYGNSLASRLIGICSFFEFTGTDRRIYERQ